MDIEDLPTEKEYEREINQSRLFEMYVVSKQHEYDLNKQIRKRLRKCRDCFYFNQQIMDTSIYRQKQCLLCQQSFYVPFLFKQSICSKCSEEADVCVQCTQPLD